LRFKIRNVAVIGLAVAAVGACGSPAAESSGTPDFVVPSATPTVTSGAVGSATTAGSPSAHPSSTPPATTAKTKITYAFPVIGNNSYAHTHHDYPATDLITKCGNKVVAATSGTILAAVRKDTWTAKVNAGATRGGLSVSILGDDGVRYYGSHLSAIDPAITVGARVKTGQSLGKVGETGDAGACHLHFGISPPCAGQGDWWTQRGVIWPWRYLDSWRTGGQRSPVAEIKTWKAANGCPTKPRVDP
jgi:murein DD-endopeptidase MepM/ murein hydrolase activator NlpD